MPARTLIALTAACLSLALVACTAPDDPYAAAAARAGHVESTPDDDVDLSTATSAAHDDEEVPDPLDGGALPGEDDDLDPYQRIAATVESQALAEETLAFLESVSQKLLDAGDAGDRAGVRDAVEMPAFRLIKRWSEQGIMQAGARFDGCHLGAVAAMGLAEALLDDPSLNRTESIRHNAREHERNLELCRKQVAG